MYSRGIGLATILHAIQTKENGMTEERNAMSKLTSDCWKDETLKARFMSDPKAVLAEYGLTVPDELNISVVENADNVMHITLPATPEDIVGIKDEELAMVAGGNQPYCTIVKLSYRKQCCDQFTK